MTTIPDERDTETLVLTHLDLAKSLAAHYRNRGESYDDLVQVASLGLVKAAKRYDPDAGYRFAAYAIPTITGEIRRYFRDHGWAVRPPRRLQELRARLLAEGPTAADLPDDVLALRLGVSAAEVREARQASNAYSAVSLDARGGPDDETPLSELLADEADPARLVDDLLSLGRATTALDDRERRMLRLRFYEEATQSQIAAELGVSQMQVSRLLTALMARLRGLLGDQVPVRELTADRGRNGPVGAPAWSRMPSSSSARTSRAA